MTMKWLVSLRNMWKSRSIRQEEVSARDAHSTEVLADLQNRRDAVEGFLIPRQRRNHWQEAIVTMIHSGRAQ